MSWEKIAMKLGPKLSFAFVNQTKSNLGGLPFYNYLYDQLGLAELISTHLPQGKLNSTKHHLTKFKAMVMGFIAGADCLDDWERLRFEPVFSKLCKTHAANTYGEFLRSFTPAMIKELNYKLTKLAKRLVSTSFGGVDTIRDIDSTVHLQHGKKMEGAKTNYQNIYGLDSLQAYDQFGFIHWLDVRSGATHTANGSSEVISQIFKGSSPKARKLLRADSGYCNVDVFNAAVNAEADFIICMRSKMYRPLFPRIKHWKACKKIKFYDGRDAEYGECLYYPIGSRRAFRVIVIRAHKEEKGSKNLFEYDYYSWVTTIGCHEKSAEKIVLEYRKRGQVEQYIKEIKNGFDLKHFPCQSLVANRAFGVIAAFAYNLLRLMSFISRTGSIVHYAKLTRQKTLFLPVDVVRTGGNIILRINKKLRREFEHWKHKINRLGFWNIPIEKKTPRSLT